MAKNINILKILIFTAIPVYLFLIAGVYNVSAAEINLMPNPTFSADPSNTAVPLDWKFSTFGSSTAVSEYPAMGPDTSTTALKINVSSYTDGFVDWFSNPVPITPFAEYQFSDFYLSDTTGIIEAQYTTKDPVTGVVTSYFTDLAYTSATSGSWATTSVSFTAPPDATSIMIFHLINNVGSLTIANPSLIKTADPAAFPQGMVSITFDDGNQSNYDRAFPILKSAGIPGTFYIISQSMLDAAVIGTSTGDINNDYMDASEIMEINRAGNEIGNHTVNHCNLITGLCPDAEVPNSPDSLSVVNEIEQASSTLHQIGALPLDTFSYPYGAYNQTIEDDVVSAGFISARSVDRGYNLTTSNRYALKIQYVTSSSTTLADFQTNIKPWIDTAIQNNVWLILLFHQIEPANIITTEQDPDATTPEVFQAVVDYLKQNNVSVVTVHDGVCKMAGMASNPRCSAPTVPGPATTTPASNIAPVVALLGANPLNITVNTLFTDPGATATDTEDGDLTSQIVKTGTVNASSTGSYLLTYSVTDSGGLSASTTRTVVVNPETCTSNCGGGNDGESTTTPPIINTAPTIALIGANPLNLVVGDIFNDPGATAKDTEDGDATTTAHIVISGSVDASSTGSYLLTYSVTDSGGLSASADRTVVVSATSTPPVIEPPKTDDPPSDPTPAAPTPKVNKSGGGGGRLGGHRHPISLAGEVLGASSCVYLRDYLKSDWKNNSVETLKLQSFLNVFEKEKLSLTGVFDTATQGAVSRFQSKYKDEILKPWGYENPTGFVYMLSKKKINEIYCKTSIPLSQTEQNEIVSFNSSVK